MIAIVDYGAGNLRSISRALVHAGERIVITDEPTAILQADRVVLPGVGNARAAMDRLRSSGLAATIGAVVADDKPLLGICLGMQLLFGEQEEGPTTGFGFIPGSCRRLPGGVKVPHMGWNDVHFDDGQHDGMYYFVHSYAVHPTDPSDVLATTDYPTPFPSVVRRGSVWGTQFHPEKSGERGRSLLKHWLEVTR